MIPVHRLITGVSAVVLAVLFAGSAGAELPPTGGLPGVPPKPVLTAPDKIPPPPAFEPAPAVPAMKQINCGTFWTGWYQPIDPKTNPCPAGCEPGAKLNERRHLQDGTTWIDAQYQCYGVSTARSTGLETKPIRTKPLSSNAVGTLSPESGKWHSYVTVKGPNFAKAERVAVTWYPNDDGAQAQAGSITATLRKRVGTDEIEIEMPRDAGGTNGGVVRVYLFMPNQLQPVLAGRFTVSMETQPGIDRTTGTLAEPPIVVTTPPLRMTGRRLTTLGPTPQTELVEAPIAITTPALRMTGKRLFTLGTTPQAELTEPTIAITTPPLRMTGKRLMTRGTTSQAELVEPPIAITTPPLRMTGKRPISLNTPSIPIKIIERDSLRIP